MSEWFLEYGLFAAEALTFVIAFAAIVAIVVAAAARRGQQPGAWLEVTKLNEHYDDLVRAMKEKALSAKAFKAAAKAEKKARKLAAKAAPDRQRTRVWIIDFKGDLRASGVASLREEVSAIVAEAGDDDEVLVRLENAGGLVHDHGLAASQLARVKARGLRLTVAVDKVAASGGYMMACVADRIVAAPFAVLGSIGVLAQLPNFHRMLEDRGVDFEMFKGGAYKRTVTLFGETTDADRAKFQQEIDETHALFKRFVAEHRPSLDIERVSTGEHWFARDAIEHGLCDELGTSDEWLLGRRDGSELLRLRYRRRETLGKRLGRSIESGSARAVERVLERLWESRIGT